MKTKIINARILTMNGEFLIENGEVHIDEHLISYIGKTKDENTSDDSFDKIIDAKNNLIMPGFKNAHTHSAMTFLRSYADDMALQDWLYTQVFPLEGKLQKEDIYDLSVLAIMEYLTSGITSNFDMYMKPDQIAQASIDCGFRTVLCGSANDFGGSKESLREEYNTFNNLHPLISYQLGFHAEYTTSKELMQDIADLANEFKTGIHTHNSETKTEVDGCIERYGVTPTAYLNSIGMFEYGGSGFHCVHMTDEDLKICKEKNISIITNPASNAKLASGIARVNDMVDMGINVGIGTDGPASNNCLDMFREMFLTTALQKLLLSDPKALSAIDVLRMATVNGANAMGLTNSNCLAVGKNADLIMIDLNMPNMQPINNIQKNIVYSGSKQNVIMTMVNGKVLYENGNFHIGKDPSEVYKKANEIINRVSQ